MPLYCAKAARDDHARAAKKCAPMGLLTGTTFLIHLHEGGKLLLDKVHIFFPTLDSHRNGIFQILEIGIGQEA